MLTAVATGVAVSGCGNQAASSVSSAVSQATQSDFYVEIENGSTWTLTADSFISSLSCNAGAIQLNGHKLYVDGNEYTEGTASQGEAIEIQLSSSSGGHEGGKPEGNPPAKPD